jgi:hypothetical protein
MSVTTQDLAIFQEECQKVYETTTAILPQRSQRNADIEIIAKQVKESLLYTWPIQAKRSSKGIRQRL